MGGVASDASGTSGRVPTVLLWSQYSFQVPRQDRVGWAGFSQSVVMVTISAGVPVYTLQLIDCTLIVLGG